MSNISSVGSTISSAIQSYNSSNNTSTSTSTSESTKTSSSEETSKGLLGGIGGLLEGKGDSTGLLGGKGTDSIEEKKEQTLAEKLDEVEKPHLTLGKILSGKIKDDPQEIGQKTDDIMLSEEAQEKMIKIQGTDGEDIITGSVNEENGNIIINVNGEEYEYTPEEAANGFKMDLGNGDDNVDISAILGNFVIDAGEGDNNINLSQGRNVLTAGDGNNTIIADNAHRTRIDTGNGNNTINVNGDINTINTGSGIDNISVDGKNSKVYAGAGNDTITAGDGDNTIYGEQGKDNITVGNGKNYIDGGNGNDTINAGNGQNYIYGRNGSDKINAGNGDNYIEGGKGNDKINAGNGNNVIYGLDGNDKINVGNGDNYIDGGKGNDKINAGDGKNIIFGGRGVDNINTSSTTSRIWDDNFGNVNAGAGSQVNRYNYFENWDLGSSISVTGDDDFKMRVESDLESYKHLQTGQKMLSELDNSEHKVTIQATTDQNGYATPHEPDKAYVNPDGTRGDGTDTTISYNPSFFTERLGKPISILFHEMAHAYDNATGTKQPGEMIRDDGTTVNRRENQAVGLSTEGGIEVEHPDGTVTTGNPDQLTENAIRAELGLERRNIY